VSRKPIVVAVAALAILSVCMLPAWGHAEFEQKTAKANAEQGFTLKVPEERGPRQTYSDGQTMRWDGPEDSENPAPVVEVR
jgi:uncharacterized protein YcnI